VAKIQIEKRATLIVLALGGRDLSVPEQRDIAKALVGAQLADFLRESLGQIAAESGCTFTLEPIEGKG